MADLRPAGEWCLMLAALHERKGLQFVLALLAGMAFGFLLQRGGVTDYDVIIGQLLLKDFTVVKIMLSAVIVGSVGIHLLRSLGLARLHPKPGSLGSSALGGLVFGAGFAVLGYCPGTVAGAVGSGALDALFGGVAGILLGAGLFSKAYTGMSRGVMLKADFGDRTIPQALGVNPWLVVLPACALMAVILWLLESGGH